MDDVVAVLDATRTWYARAAVELAETSPLQVSWALGVAGDVELLALIAGLPREHRQPSLLFAVAAWCGAPADAYPPWRDFVIARWNTIGPEAVRRRTQTNEVGRCIPLVIGLSRIVGPVALLEIGASAGLCLAVDRYAYRFDGGPILGPAAGPASEPGWPEPPLMLTASTSGQPPAHALELKDSPSTPECGDAVTRRTPPRGPATAQATAPATGQTTASVAPPSRMPEIVWRAGIDLAPLDVRDAGDVRWLEALVPPDRPERRARLRAAIGTVRGDPPNVVAGDALEALAEVAAGAPREATLVVASLGTMVYLPPATRAALPDAVAALGGRLVTFEPTAAVPGVPERLRHLVAPEPTPFVLAVDGEPIAHGSAHGDRISWLSAGHPELPGSPT